jgi:hypothetical protein
MLAIFTEEPVGNMLIGLSLQYLYQAHLYPENSVDVPAVANLLEACELARDILY